MEPRQTPTYEANVPEDLSGDGEMACELATVYFGDPLPWQPHLLDAMLARDFLRVLDGERAESDLTAGLVSAADCLAARDADAQGRFVPINY